MRFLRLLVGLSLIAVVASAWAVDRRFPPVAKRGTLVFLGDRDVTIDEQPARLSVGSRIWDGQNVTHVRSSFTGLKATANYTLTPKGEIDRVWILNDKEAAQTPEEQKINRVK
jgi:hypothetical protein